MKILKLIHIGFRNNGQELASTFIEEGKSDREENLLFFKKSKYPIGAIFLAEKTQDTISLRTKSIQKEKVENMALVKKWALLSKAAEAETKDINARYKVERTLFSEDFKSELKQLTSGLTTKELRYLVDFIVYEVREKEEREEMQKKLNQMLSRSSRRKQL